MLRLYRGQPRCYMGVFLLWLIDVRDVGTFCYLFVVFEQIFLNWYWILIFLSFFPFLNTDYGGYHKVNECPVCWSGKGMKRTPSFGSVASLSRNKNIDGSWVCDHRVKKKLDKHNLVVTTRITSLFPELNSVKPLWIALGGPTQPPQACRRACRPRWPGVPVGIQLGQVNHPGRSTAGTYSHHPFRKEHDLNQTPPGNYDVSAVNLQGCIFITMGQKKN